MKKSYTIKNLKIDDGITLVSLVVTIVILLILSGIAIATLGGENGLFVRVKQAKKAHIQAEMQEQLTLALNELQIDKKGNASLDDATQDWINTVISSDYSPTIKEDASLNGKLVVMNKSDITGKFLIGQNLEISSFEYNLSSLEFEYETEKIENGKVKILIKITDKINGLKQVDYPGPNENPLVMENRKTPLGIDYYVELGKEYKFVITTGDGNKTEKTIKIDDYYYNITKTLEDGTTIDNNATKVSYNKTYEATVSTEGNYAITGITVTMGGQAVTTSGNNVVDVNTGKIKIEKVTGDIDIKVTTKELKIQCTAVVSKSNSSTATSSEEANKIEKGTPLYINIIATLEGNKCTVVLKSDNTKTVPYQVSSNGKYTFKVSGTYNGKTVEEEKEVIVNQYMSAQGVVQYDAGNWTQAEINELGSLYNYNSSHTASVELNFTFGGFKAGDSRNSSVSPQSGWGTPKYEGWQVLESEEKTVNGEKRLYIKSIVHAGAPENFVYYYSQKNDAYRAEYILSSGKTKNSSLTSNIPTKTRNWDKYKDQSKLDLIDSVRCMTYEDAYKITNNSLSTNDLRRTTGAYYWLGSASSNISLWLVYDNGSLSGYVGGFCFGVRPVVSLKSGVYAVSGDGSESAPYILGKD